MRPFTKVHTYDPATGAYTGESVAYATPALWDAGEIVFDYPINSTTVEPPMSEPNMQAFWDAAKAQWVLIPDYTSTAFYDIKTGERVNLLAGQEPDLDKVTELAKPAGKAMFCDDCWIEAPKEEDPLRPSEWDPETKAWINRKLALTGQELSSAIKTVIALEPGLQAKIKLANSIGHLLLILDLQGELTTSDFNLVKDYFDPVKWQAVQALLVAQPLP